MAYKKWVFAPYDLDTIEKLKAEFDLEPLIAHILISRGITDSVEVAKFLSDSHETVSPYCFADMEEAEFAVGNAMDCGEKICIYGDYDCDGITATTILYSYLKSEGADVFYYIPNRVSEGYGMNKAAIDRIHQQGANLIITVDNGISAVEEAEYIYSLGMQLVVTDHHQLGDTLPRAEAVVNPHRPENELTFRDYCGAAVAYKLVCALCQGDEDVLAQQYMDLVAIATVADVVSLHGENRSFVKQGLRLINTVPRPSLRAFTENARRELTASEISFQVAPRLNALGRIGDAGEAVEFLLCEDMQRCRSSYEHLCAQNDARKKIEDDILRSVEEQIKRNKRLVCTRVIVIAGKNYHKGIVGIVAARVKEKYGKPAIIIGINDDGIACGSARTVEGFNIYDAIHACSDDLMHFGGHPGAAGVTLSADRIDDFRRHLHAYAEKHYKLMPPDVLHIDFSLAVSKLNTALADTLRVLEPCGEDNTVPVIALKGVTLTKIESPMKNGEKTNRTVFEFTKKGAVQSAVMFSVKDTDVVFRKGDVCDIAVQISKSIYGERAYLSARIVAMRKSGTDEERYFAERDVYEKYLLGTDASPTLLPERKDFVTVYKFLKAHRNIPYDITMLYFDLQNEIAYGRLCVAVAALCQGGLAKTENGRIYLLPAQGTVDLEKTKVMQTLKGRIKHEI